MNQVFLNGRVISVPVIIDKKSFSFKLEVESDKREIDGVFQESIINVVYRKENAMNIKEIIQIIMPNSTIFAKGEVEYDKKTDSNYVLVSQLVVVGGVV